MLTLIFRAVAAPRPHLFKAKKVLFVGPHPDDIEIGCGGTVLELIDAGVEVSFIICTDDRYSSIESSYDRAAQMELRKKEALAACGFMGVRDVHFLDFQDGGLSYTVEDMTRALTLLYASIDADIIFAPDPNMRDECHLDHLKVGRAALAALCTSDRPGIVQDLGGTGVSRHKAVALYYTDRPNTYVRVSGSNMKKKLEAIYLHESQMFGNERNNITMYTKFRAIRFGLRRLCRYAEGFRLLEKSFHHCVTEWCDI